MTTLKNIPKNVIASYLPKNPVIVEAGAHIGRDTKKMLTAWPNCYIHAFEPVPELFKQLQATIQNFSNVTGYHFALSNQTGTTSFFMSSGRSTATSSLHEPTLYKETHPDTIFTAIEVNAVTLDDWSKKYGIPKVDGLWLDMQGAELKALQGAKNLLKTISVIYTEVNFIERYKGIPLFNEFKEWLIDHGFTVALEACGNYSDWGNVLFVRSKE